MRWLAVAVCALALAPSALAQTGTTTGPVYDKQGNLVETPFAPSPDDPRLTLDRATDAVLAHPKVAKWLERDPPDPITEATYDRQTRGGAVQAWSGGAGEQNGRAEWR